MKETGQALADLIQSSAEHRPGGHRDDARPARAPPRSTAPCPSCSPVTITGGSSRLLPLKTLLFAQGSTGASGLRGLEGEKPTPAKASVLYFNRTTRALAGVGRHHARRAGTDLGVDRAAPAQLGDRAEGGHPDAERAGPPSSSAPPARRSGRRPGSVESAVSARVGIRFGERSAPPLCCCGPRRLRRRGPTALIV